MAGEARVVDLMFETAHDSESLVVVVIEHPNGARGQLQLPGEAVSHLVDELGLATIRGLVGLAFSEIAPALPANAAGDPAARAADRPPERRRTRR